jgi:hypothetical protein
MNTSWWSFLDTVTKLQHLPPMLAIGDALCWSVAVLCANVPIDPGCTCISAYPRQAPPLYLLCPGLPPVGLLLREVPLLGCPLCCGLLVVQAGLEGPHRGLQLAAVAAPAGRLAQVARTLLAQGAVALAQQAQLLHLPPPTATATSARPQTMARLLPTRKSPYLSPVPPYPYQSPVPPYPYQS